MSTQPTRNIVLVGYRGCGKTSVGKVLADKINWTLVDTDARIEADAGRTIREIFVDSGEPAFRALETKAISRVAKEQHVVISVGGGAVLAEENRLLLKSAGSCIWLTAPAEELYARMQTDPRNHDNRPALTDKAGLDEVKAVLNVRTPMYNSVADHTIDTCGKTVETIAAEILGWLGRRVTPSQ